MKSKGRVAYASAYVTSLVRGLGYKQVVIKSDNEPAIIALRRAVGTYLGGAVGPEGPPVGEKQANGAAVEAGGRCAR